MKDSSSKNTTGMEDYATKSSVSSLVRNDQDHHHDNSSRGDGDLNDDMMMEDGTRRSSTHSQSHEKEERVKIAGSESKYVFWARVTLFTVLLVVTCSICYAVFWFASAKEEEDFTTTFHEIATKVADTFQANAARRVGAIESFAVTIASNAKSMGQRWPNVTVDDYEERATHTLNLAEVISLMFIPIVTLEARKGWEAYSQEHQGWYKEGLALQKDANLVQTGKALDDEQTSIDILEGTWGSSPDGSVPEEIFRVNGTAAEAETGEGPYAPWWQFGTYIRLISFCIAASRLYYQKRKILTTAYLYTTTIRSTPFPTVYYSTSLSGSQSRQLQCSLASLSRAEH